MPLILQWTNDDTGALEYFQFDAVTSISHEDTEVITDHPVEEGLVTSDHARDEPEFVSIEGLITNTPHSGNYTADDQYSDQPLTLSFPTRKSGGTQEIPLDVDGPPLQPNVSSLVGAGLGALKNAVFGGPKATMVKPSTEGPQGSLTVTVKQPTVQRDRAREAYEKLLAAKLAKDFITVDTGMRAYFDMLIQRIAVPRAVEDGTSVRFQVDLRRVRIASSQTVQAPRPVEPRALGTKNNGSKAAKEADEHTAELASHAYNDGVATGVIKPGT